MLQDKKNKAIPKGDYVTENEALMDEEYEIKSRCESVNDVVSQNIMPLTKALKAYNVTFEQYFGSLLLNKKKVKISFDGIVIATLAQMILSYMDTKNTKLDANSERLVEDMRLLSTSK